VYIDGVRKARVAVHNRFDTVSATVDGSGTRAAIVDDYDGTHGSELLVLDAVSGTVRTLVKGPVTSAVFSPDGKQLAYLEQGDGRATVYTGTPAHAGRPVATVPGLGVRLLGWRADGSSLFATGYPDLRQQSNLPPDLARVDLRTGTTTAVLTSDVARHTAYRDFRLTSVGGRQMLSFIRTGTGYACGDQPTDIALADLDGHVVRTFGRTQDTYREAVWSSDGSQVAYTAQACPTKTDLASGAGKSALARRADAVAGTHVADTATGARTEVVHGNSPFQLTGLDHGVARIAHDRFGARTVDSAAVTAGRAFALPASALRPTVDLAPARARSSTRQSPAAGTVTPMALTNSAVFVNQIYDTPDAFDGRGSCGPTSSVMNLGGYQLGPWPMYVNYGGYHETDYGQYVTGVYSYGVTYSWTEPDYSGRGAWAGAHGYMFIPGVGSPWSGGWGVYDYLDHHTGWAQYNGGFNSGTVVNQLNGRYLVVAGGTIHGLSHIVLIKGYTSDGGWVVNDPYGPYTGGGWGGADQVYYLGSDMSLWNSVAN